jgi:hypothetical protein
MEMHVDGALVEQAAEELVAGGADPAWFAARQPGIVKYLERVLGGGTELCGVALASSLAICSAYEKALGVPPARVRSSLLGRAEKAILFEARSAAVAMPPDGLVARQPAICEFVASVVAAPPVPLDADDAGKLGLALMAVAYALDETTSGRPVP